MVNGTTSRYIYFGAYGLIALCLVGIIVSGFFQVEVDGVVKSTLAMLLAFIVGAHVKAPDTVGTRDTTTGKGAPNG